MQANIRKPSGGPTALSLASNFNKLWFNKYGVTNVLENDLCALISRIWFVQSREESRMFFGI